MTSTTITDKMVEKFGNSLRKLAGLEPASYVDMLETTPKVVEHIRLHLEAVAPMILEEAAKRWQPIETAQKDGTRVFVATSTAIHTAVYDRIEGCWCVLPRRITTRVPVPGTVIGWLPLDTLPPLPLPPEPRP
jgi:hypothetical protein